MEPSGTPRPLYADVLEITPVTRTAPAAFDSPALLAWAWQESPAVAILYRFAAVQVMGQLSGARRKAAGARDFPTIFLRSE